MDAKYKIIKDPEFGFQRVDPIPTQEEVEKYYAEEFYSANYQQLNDSSLEVQQEDKEFYDARWEGIYNVCVSHLGDLTGRSLFDIGFGFAQALLYFHERNVHVCGLEPSEEGVKYAADKGLDVHQAGIEDFSCVGEKRFNIVMLLNVLEHLRKPAETLRNINEQLLTDDGLLVIDVPNEFNDFQTIANDEHDLKQWWLCPPNHINYFSASSLTKLLQECGYEVVHTEASFPLEMFMLMDDVYVGNGTLGKQCHNKRVNFERLMRKHGKLDKLNKFYEALASLDLGRQVVAYARKAR